MSPVVLILVFCLGPACQEQRQFIDSPISCMLQGQVRATEWLNGHKRWKLRSWRCEMLPVGQNI